jgi:opacity protein-like surface antigen
MRRYAIIAIAVGALALAQSSAHAQGWGMSGFGGQIGYTSPDDLEGTIQLGAHLEFEHSGSRFHLMPNLMYWSENDVSNINPNVDLYYHFNSEGMITPYVGGGLGVHFINDDRFDVSDTNLGLNVLAGLRFPTSYSHYFLEGRYTASDISQFSLLGGITLHR